MTKFFGKFQWRDIPCALACGLVASILFEPWTLQWWLAWSVLALFAAIGMLVYDRLTGKEPQ